MAQCVGDVFAIRVTSTKRSKPPEPLIARAASRDREADTPNLAAQPGGYPTDIRRQWFRKRTTLSRHSIRFRVVIAGPTSRPAPSGFPVTSQI